MNAGLFIKRIAFMAFAGVATVCVTFAYYIGLKEQYGWIVGLVAAIPVAVVFGILSLKTAWSLSKER